MNGPERIHVGNILYSLLLIAKRFPLDADDQQVVAFAEEWLDKAERDQVKPQEQRTAA